jgi:hypothetical protein
MAGSREPSAISNKIFFISPLTLTLRDPRQYLVVDGIDVISAEKKQWLTQ